MFEMLEIFDSFFPNKYDPLGDCKNVWNIGVRNKFLKLSSYFCDSVGSRTAAPEN